MFNQSQDTLDQMYQVWCKMDSPEKEVMSSQIFQSLNPSEQNQVTRKSDGWGRGFGGASYINLLLSLILHPASRWGLEEMSKMWRERDV